MKISIAPSAITYYSISDFNMSYLPFQLFLYGLIYERTCQSPWEDWFEVQDPHWQYRVHGPPHR